MNNDEVVDGEVINIVELPAKNEIPNLKWRMRDGNIVALRDMADSHLRNSALFLMGLGFQKCIAKEPLRVLWLTAMRIEWERRMLLRKGQGLKKYVLVDIEEPEGF